MNFVCGFIETLWLNLSHFPVCVCVRACQCKYVRVDLKKHFPACQRVLSIIKSGLLCSRLHKNLKGLTCL